MRILDMGHNSLPETGFVRLPQIVGDKKADPPIPAIIPVSKSTWWAGVKSGRYPQPVKLSERCTAWRVEDIRALVDTPEGGQVMLSHVEDLKPAIFHDLNPQDAGPSVDVKPSVGCVTDQELVGPGVLIGDEPSAKPKAHRSDTWVKTQTRLYPRCGR